MVGIISVQNSIGLASKSRGTANSTVSADRIREREGIMSGDEKAVEQGQELQAKGEEIKAGSLTYLREAMDGVNNINSAVEFENYEKIREEKRAYELGAAAVSEGVREPVDTLDMSVLAKNLAAAATASPVPQVPAPWPIQIGEAVDVGV